MKKVMLTICCCVLLLGVAGCGEEFAAGFGTGAVASKKIFDDAQDRFVEAVNNLNTETERLNTEIGAVKDINVEAFIKPETLEAVKGLKGREKDPVTWIALASVLANMFWGGKTYGSKKSALPTP